MIVSKPIFSAGLLFSHLPHAQVALVRKDKHRHFMNRYNAIIDEVNENELPLDAMTRIFKEETGVEFAGWQEAIILECPHIVIHFYRGFCTTSLWNIVAQKDEDIHFLTASRVFDLDVVSNLRWIIPLMLDDTIRMPIHVNDVVMEIHKGPPDQGS